MQQVNVTVHRRARWQLEELPEKERRAILEAVESLRRLPLDEWPRDRVHVVDADRGVYLLSVGPTWRAFIDRGPAGDLEVGAVTSQEFLDSFRQAGRTNGKKKA